jgi:hypothetical protein
VITAVHLTIDITKATFYFSLLLVVQLFQVIVFILSPFWAVISFVLLPLTHLIRVALSIILFPFRLRLLDKFETIYIYLGIAALVGILAGAVLHLCFGLITSALRIDAASETQKEKIKLGSRKSGNDKKKVRSLDLPSSRAIFKRKEAVSQARLFSQAIMEEDSEF